MKDLDNIDRQLIGLLRTDARASISWLSKQLNVSRATIQNRITKLEQAGVITGYTALVSESASETVAMVRALMNVELKNTSIKSLKQQLIAEPAVCAVHTTNGRWDLILELQAKSLESFDKVLTRLRDIPEISSSETSILLSSYRTKSTQL